MHRLCLFLSAAKPEPSLEARTAPSHTLVPTLPGPRVSRQGWLGGGREVGWGFSCQSSGLLGWRGVPLWHSGEGPWLGILDCEQKMRRPRTWWGGHI